MTFGITPPTAIVATVRARWRWINASPPSTMSFVTVSVRLAMMDVADWGLRSRRA